MPMIHLLDPNINKSYSTKGLGFATMRVISSRVDELDNDIYKLVGGRFSWEGTKGDFHEDFNGDTASSILNKG